MRSCLLTPTRPSSLSEEELDGLLERCRRFSFLPFFSLLLRLCFPLFFDLPSLWLPMAATMQAVGSWAYAIDVQKAMAASGELFEALFEAFQLDQRVTMHAASGGHSRIVKKLHSTVEGVAAMAKSTKAQSPAGAAAAIDIEATVPKVRGLAHVS